MLFWDGLSMTLPGLFPSSIIQVCKHMLITGTSHNFLSKNLANVKSCEIAILTPE